MDTFFDDFKVKCDEISAKGILKLKKIRIDRAGWKGGIVASKNTESDTVLFIGLNIV